MFTNGILRIGFFSLLMTSALVSKAATVEGWDEFQTNSVNYMNKPVVVRDANGQVVRDSAFPASDIDSGEFAHTKYRLRKAPPAPTGRFYSLAFEGVGGMKTKLMQYFDASEFASKHVTPLFSLQEIEKANLENSELATQPWSGSYWPLYQGGVAARYATHDFDHSWSTWKESRQTFQKEGDLKDVLENHSSIAVDDLSPAEKYDLLIGDPRTDSERSGFLTSAIWLDNERYVNRDGEIESWMGLCHGWAPASLVDARPSHSVEGAALTGEKVKFYPADLKALSTLLWANGDFDHQFIGGRCGQKNPKTDPASGRLLDPDCFDVNPAVWHLLVVNQLGVLKRGFVIDATYDYQVWNQPVFSYSYHYFNPQTGESVKTLEDAIVQKNEFTKDKFKNFRAADAVSYVGIEMSIQYTGETWSDHSETDSPEQDQIRTATYLYDLEFNANGDIIGGEWYKNGHPDFVWAANNGAKAMSAVDGMISTPSAWNPQTPLPKFWRDLAAKAASYGRQPVAKIVEALMSQ